MKNELLWAIVLLVGIFGGAWFFTSRPAATVSDSNEEQKTAEQTAQDVNTNVNTNMNTPTNTNELKITDIVVGTGAEAVAGKTVSVHYTGTFLDGTKFDSSLDRGQPFSFTLGAGQVIKGWDQGVAGMKVGGKRELVIPPALGYGDRATGPIPANSTLKFTVELLGVE